MLENGMILYENLPHNQNELIVDWDGIMVQPGERYVGVWDQYQGVTILILDEPDQIISWLDTTEYDCDKPAFIKRYSELDTSAVIDDMMEGWFTKDANESDVEFFERYVNIQFREIVVED